MIAEIKRKETLSALVGMLTFVRCLAKYQLINVRFIIAGFLSRMNIYFNFAIDLVEK